MFEKLVAVALILTLFVAVWRIESGWRIVFTPFLLAMYFELTRVFPAFLLADRYAGIDSTYALWVAVSAYVALLVGFVAAYSLPIARPHDVLALAASHRPLRLDHLDALSVAALALLLAVLGLYFFGGLPATVRSLLGLVIGGGDAELARQVSEQRFALTKGAYFGAAYRGQGLITQIEQVGWMLVCVFTLLRHLQLRTWGSLALLAGSLIGAWVFVAGVGSRAPLLNVLICMLAAWSLRRPLPMRAVISVIVAGILIGVGLSLYSAKMYSLLAGALGFGDFVTRAVIAIAERVLIGNGINDVYSIEFVRTGVLPISYGAIHHRDLLAAIPGVQVEPPLAYTLYLLIDASAGGTTFRSATYLSDVFVDFWWPGVLIIFPLIGCVLAMAQRLLLRAPPDPWSLALGVTASLAAMNLLSGGPVALASMLVVLATLWFLRRAIRMLLSMFAVASMHKSWQ